MIAHLLQKVTVIYCHKTLINMAKLNYVSNMLRELVLKIHLLIVGIMLS
jgi:hypothetical protein